MREIRTSGLTRGRGNLPPYSTGEKSPVKASNRFKVRFKPSALRVMVDAKPLNP